MQNKVFAVRPTSLHVLLLLSSCLWCGCSGGVFPDPLKPFKDAIAEVEKLRLDLVSQSDAWRKTLEQAQLQLTDDVRTIINVDIRDNIDKSIAEIGGEFNAMWTSSTST